MARDAWSEQLEAYLDGELDTAAAAAFEAETNAVPELRRELAARQVFRVQARRALLAEATAEWRHPAQVPIRRRRRWPILAAAAAALAVIVLAPALRRLNENAGEPRPAITRAGPVTALRFGESPNRTLILETGCYDQSSDTVQ